MPTRPQRRLAPPTSAAQRIVAGARQHFLAHGFRNVTMDDVAQELGMSKKTLYAHFTSKVELLEAVIRSKLDDLDRDLEQISPYAKDDFLHTLHRLLNCTQEHAREIQPAFVRDVRREAPEVFELVEQLRNQAIQLHFGRVFSAGRQQGLIRKDVSVQLLIEIFLGVTHAILNPAKLAELKLTPQTGFAAVSNVIFEGVLTQRGRIKQ
jgi:AcrR family transcriptional regulator